MADTENSSEGIRQRVRALYERHPYPPPSDDIDILIAGCGTRQAAEMAALVPGARIVAMDISESGLRSTEALLKKIGRTGVRLERLAIEETASLGLDFDLVISTGVLHHLAEPAVGLAALAHVLRPHGSMFLMLYGRHGRVGVYMLQEMFRHLGMDPSTVGKRDLLDIRKLVAELPPTHPFATGRFVDHLSDEGLVDLLLHVQDRAYSLPEIHRFLDGAGLKMQKLMFQALYDPQFTALASSGFSKHLDGVDERERLAAGELFRASIKKHSFIACHKARPADTYEISRKPDNWDRLIPIRNKGFAAEQPTATRRSVRLTLPYLEDDSIHVDVDPDLIPFLAAFDDKRTVREALAAASLAGPAKQIEARVGTLLDRLASAEFLGFRIKA